VSLLGTNPPFQGKTLEQLAATSAFLLSAGITLASAVGLAHLLSGWQLPRNPLITNPTPQADRARDPCHSGSAELSARSRVVA